MQRLRVRYTKTGRVRYVSARDLSSVWERALRRAGLPIAYSEGFHPHPKVSFPDALPVGYESTGEYAELTFTAPLDLEVDVARLSSTLPPGMGILTVLEAPDGAPKLARLLRDTLWELVLPADLPASELQTRIDRLIAATTLEVVRQRPDGDRTLDVRPAVVAMELRDDPTPRIRAVLHNDGPTIRPTDLYAALDPEHVLPAPTRYRRVAQGEAVVGGVREALDGSLVSLAGRRVIEAA